MAHLHKVFTAAIFCIPLSGVIALGCWPFDPLTNCTNTITCAGMSPAGASSGGGGTPSSCVPSENTDAVGDECGVFASDSLGDDDTGEGTKSKPFKTLATAVDRANGKPVYACSETFAEALILPAGTELYGGIDCTQGWIYGGDTARTMIAPGAEQIPLKLSSGSALTRIENVHGRSAGAMQPGGSSIAAIVDGATAELTRCDFAAGTGAAGEGGEGLPADPTLTGAPGNPGANACMGTPTISGNPGGMSAAKACDSSEMTVGGKGGDGGKIDPGPPVTALAGGDGEDGLPVATSGKKGIGEPEVGTWGCGAGGGQDGDPGVQGNAGAGASGLGMVNASGYTGVAGIAGMTGKPGQGGGGGGGAKGGTNICAGGLEGAGASGGSGGSGGCGGKGGAGGKAGGASIVLISLNATVTLTDCTLMAGQGGIGGMGGTGQPGASGGAAGTAGTGVGGSNDACDGGKGGKGGNGGPGGGGLGGHSFGIAYQGSAPLRQNNVIITPGSAGMGGPGGNANVGMNQGESGQAREEQEFL
jgi:hypothetical protein